MGKMTSLLEKYKLIEKDEPDSSESEESFNDERSKKQENSQANVSSSEKHTPSSIESSHNLSEDTAEPQVSNERIDAAPATTPESISEDNIHSNIASPPYDKLLNLDEIYKELHLDQIATTDTVFLLENLIKALPEELPEFVKKTTVNNIIQASAMNLPKLLEDGNARLKSLKQFSIDYTHANSEEISALKSEITRLSAIVADYHQQIKHKETLISDETNLIQTEQNRIQAILEFFNN